MTATKTDLGSVQVCTDCYFAHHYGAKRVERPATDREIDMREFPDTYRRELMGLEWIDDETVAEWFAGESDQRCEGGEPLQHVPEFGTIRNGWIVDAITDWTCSNHFYGQDDVDDDTVCDHCGQTGYDDGITEFTWTSCDGCDSHLGGSRYRLAVHWKPYVAMVAGVECETGCWVSGHWGQFMGDHLADKIEIEWPQLFRDDPRADPRYHRMMAGIFDQLGDESEAFHHWEMHSETGYELEQWLNDHTTTHHIWSWYEGEMFLAPYCGRDDEPCGFHDETCWCHTY